jgi:hypothetical protein
VNYFQKTFLFPLIVLYFSYRNQKAAYRNGKDLPQPIKLPLHKKMKKFAER